MDYAMQIADPQAEFNSSLQAHEMHSRLALSLAADDDVSEVQQSVRVCTNLLDFICTLDVINSLEDLVVFAKTVSSALIQLTKGVNARANTLTSQSTREKLCRALEQTKQLIPVLINTVRTIIAEKKDAASTRRIALVENRSALVHEVCRILAEIIRLLQSGEANANGQALRRNGGVNGRTTQQNAFHQAEVSPILTLIRLADSAFNELERNLPAAQAWINDSQAPVGSPNEAAFRLIVDLCTANCRAMNDSLVTLQRDKTAAIPESSLRAFDEDRRALSRLIDEIAALVSGLIEMRANDQRERPSAHSLERGLKAKLPQLKEALQALRTRLHSMRRLLPNADCGLDSELRRSVQKEASGKLVALVCEATIDLHGPLRQLVAAARAPQAERRTSNESTFERLIDEFLIRNKALFTAAASVHQELDQRQNGTEADPVLQLANKLMQLSPQVLAAARTRLITDEAHAEQLLTALYNRWLTFADRLRIVIDSRMDNKSLIRSLERTIMRRHAEAVRSIDACDFTTFAVIVADSARRAHRVVLFARVKAQSGEDDLFVRHAQLLEPLITTYVTYATNVARQPNDSRLINVWQEAARLLLQQVTKLRLALDATVTSNETSLQAGSSRTISPDDGTDTDTEDAFPVTSKLTASSREPLLLAARELHMDVRQWSSSDNEIVAAAKRLALLMAHLSQIVKDENCTKSELTESVRAINDAAVEITRLAKQVGQACSDRLMRTALLQACERIPTIATQLKIVATVKASLLGSQGGDEDREATEALVNNAKNLMEGVRDTVKAAESASIKMRIDAGISLKWLRKRPWYM